ncbi:hypothetical protein ACFE04_021453 [Oxalis oulophora]
MLKENISKRQQSSSCPPFVQCAELILPWITPVELANISLTSKPLHKISFSITTQSSLNASRPSQLALESPSVHTNNGTCIVVGCYCDKCGDEDEGCPYLLLCP